MLVHIPFLALDGRHLDQLVRSLYVAPEAVRLDAGDILHQLFSNECCAFRFEPDGLLIVRKRDSRLEIVAFDGPVLLRAELAADLKRLAADWECDAIEKMVFDPRLAHAIEKVGGRVESLTIILAVKD